MSFMSGTLTEKVPIPILYHGSHNVDRDALSRKIRHCRIIRVRSAGSMNSTVEGSNISGRYGW